MTDTSSSAQAEALVAEKRRLVAEEGQRHRPELARALLDLSRAHEQADRAADALAAARESVAMLSADLLAKPQWFAGPMRAAIAQYVGLAQRSREKPDEALLAPIAEALGAVTRAEDEAEDEGR